jgi:hypothetical protein
MDIELNPGPEPSKKQLTLVHMNIQSLYMSSVSNKRVKLDEIISTFAIEKEIYIITMSETWLHDQIDDKLIEIPGYSKPFRKDRPGRRGGGVVAFVTNNIVCKRLTELEPANIDLLWLELMLSGKKVIIGIGYRPPKQNSEEVDVFMDQFKISLDKIMGIGSESVIIMGDFNDTCLQWDDSHDQSDLKKDFHDMINLADMVQLVNEPTHITDHSKSLIDLIITDSPGYVSAIDLLPPLGSKHVTLYLEFKIKYSRDKNFKRHVWDYTKGDYDKLNKDITDYPWDDLINQDCSMDTKAENWTASYLGLCRDNIPNRDIIVRPRDLPWFTHECKCLIRDRNRLYKKFRRRNTTANETKWKDKAREVRVALNLARLNYRNKMMTTLNDPTIAAKKYWSLVKHIYGSKKGLGIPVIEMGNKQLSTSTDKANAFTKFFCKQQTIVEPTGHELPPLVMLTDQRLTTVETSPEKLRIYWGHLNWEKLMERMG